MTVNPSALFSGLADEGKLDLLIQGVMSKMSGTKIGHKPEN